MSTTGRPKKDKVIAFKVDPELLSLLESYAAEVQMPKSEVIRRALWWYLKKVVGAREGGRA